MQASTSLHACPLTLCSVLGPLCSMMCQDQTDGAPGSILSELGDQESLSELWDQGSLRHMLHAAARA